jgi:hypothetical protein
VPPPLRVEVLRKRSELSQAALQCADLALHCVEPARLDQYRFQGTRCVLVWVDSQRLGALFPFGAPARFHELPLVALKSPPPLLRAGWAQACVEALFDWFRRDGEGAALLEIRGVAKGGAVYRAFAEAARRRERFVLCAPAAEGRTCTLLVGDRAWGELTTASLPLSRWAKRAAASLVYGGVALAPL